MNRYNLHKCFLCGKTYTGMPNFKKHALEHAEGKILLDN